MDADFYFADSGSDIEEEVVETAAGECKHTTARGGGGGGEGKDCDGKHGDDAGKGKESEQPLFSRRSPEEAAKALRERKAGDGEARRAGGSGGGGVGAAASASDGKAAAVAAAKAKLDVLRASGYVGKQEISDDQEMIQRLFGFVSMCLMRDLSPLFKENMHRFDPDNARHRDMGDGEYDVEQYAVFQEFEQAVDERLETFAKEEGFTSTKRLFNVIRATADRNRNSRKLVRLINRATDFPRFLKWMAKRVADQKAGYF